MREGSGFGSIVPPGSERNTGCKRKLRNSFGGKQVRWMRASVQGVWETREVCREVGHHPQGGGSYPGECLLSQHQPGKLFSTLKHGSAFVLVGWIRIQEGKIDPQKWRNFKFWSACCSLSRNDGLSCKFLFIFVVKSLDPDPDDHWNRWGSATLPFKDVVMKWSSNILRKMGYPKFVKVPLRVWFSNMVPNCIWHFPCD